MIEIILLIAAVIFFLLAAFNVSARGVSLGWIGAACLAGFFLVPLI